jgi:hypothetical protein
MVALERQMQRTGGRGIIALELAGNAVRAERIMASWGAAGQRAARWSLWLDFGYMLSYGAVSALLLDRARRYWGHPAVVVLAAAPPVIADAIEGVALLAVLRRHDIGANARRARMAAKVKFALLAAALGYVATSEAARKTLRTKS